MATLEQANALLALGFNEAKNPKQRKRDMRLRKGRESPRHIMEYYAKMMLRGQGRKASSVGYIQANISDEQAGVLIRLLATMQGKERTGAHRSVAEQKRLAANRLAKRQAIDTDNARNSSIVEEKVVEHLPK